VPATRALGLAYCVAVVGNGVMTDAFVLLWWSRSGRANAELSTQEKAISQAWTMRGSRIQIIKFYPSAILSGLPCGNCS
jgi:hypothetical protein